MRLVQNGTLVRALFKIFMFFSYDPWMKKLTYEKMLHITWSLNTLLGKVKCTCIWNRKRSIQLLSKLKNFKVS